MQPLITYVVISSAMKFSFLASGVVSPAASSASVTNENNDRVNNVKMNAQIA